MVPEQIGVPNPARSLFGPEIGSATGSPVPSAAMRIRLAQPVDAEAIRRIYNAEIVGSEHTTFDLVPRTRDQQATWMVRHQGIHPAIVAADSASDGVGGADGPEEV